MGLNDPSSTPAHELLRSIAHRQVSVREVVDAHLARIEVTAALNAVVTRCDERALDEAAGADDRLARGEPLGALHGLPFTAKDALDSAGVRTTAGSRGWVDRVPRADATVVGRMRAAGAILIGKTNTPELTLDYETDNEVFGQTWNPYDTSLSPGGSSGGGASAVAAGATPVDVGTDTGGSIRLPAHFCGVAGIKPTAGRVPRTGLVGALGTPIEPLVHVGPLTRTVADLELVLGTIAGPDDRDPLALPLEARRRSEVEVGALTVAYHSDNGIVSASGEVGSVVAAAAGVVAEHGAAVREDRPEPEDDPGEIFRDMFLLDGQRWVGDLLAEMDVQRSRVLPRGVDPEVGRTTEWTRLFRRLGRFRRQMLAFLHDVDVIVAPVHPSVAREPHVLTRRENRSGFSYVVPYNLTGWPGVVVRAGASAAGLPIGVQVVAGPGREDRALAVAEVIEHELGGYAAPPDPPRLAR